MLSSVRNPSDASAIEILQEKLKNRESGFESFFTEESLAAITKQENEMLINTFLSIEKNEALEPIGILIFQNFLRIQSFSASQSSSQGSSQERSERSSQSVETEVDETSQESKEEIPDDFFLLILQCYNRVESRHRFFNSALKGTHSDFIKRIFDKFMILAFDSMRIKIFYFIKGIFEFTDRYKKNSIYIDQCSNLLKYIFNRIAEKERDSNTDSQENFQQLRRSILLLESGINEAMQPILQALQINFEIFNLFCSYYMSSGGYFKGLLKNSYLYALKNSFPLDLTEHLLRKIGNPNNFIETYQSRDSSLRRPTKRNTYRYYFYEMAVNSLNIDYLEQLITQPTFNIIIFYEKLIGFIDEKKSNEEVDENQSLYDNMIHLVNVIYKNAKDKHQEESKNTTNVSFNSSILKYCFDKSSEEEKAERPLKRQRSNSMV
ncbi:MAG: hypothetical protein ACE365_02080 [Gammaproteobacteria bacterium]